MALHLSRWATECLKRAEPGLGALSVPFALYEKQHGAMRLVELDARAEAAGLFATQSLSDARALVPALQVREIDRPFLEAVFADFADWHSYASPVVAILTDSAAYGDLVLDITGVSHLFGGEAAMLEKLIVRLTRFGFTADGAVADTVGAAWALARFAAGTVAEGGLRDILAALPVAALRLDEPQIAALSAMGLKRIGDLYQRDRRALQARFGVSLILRLDQALGHLEERLKPRLPFVEFFAERRFPEPIGLIDDVLMTAHDLAVRLVNDLEHAGLGAQEFHLFLYRVDHKLMTFSVRAGRATRDPHHISRLFAHRSERLNGDYDAGFGIDMIRLAASLTSPLTSTQIGAFETRDGTADLDRLYDRMASRLGAEAVRRTRFVNTHLPERATLLEPVITQTPDDPLALPHPGLARPLRLLPQPEPIEVTMTEVPDGPPQGMIWRRVRYRFLRARGPERIAPEWWDFEALPLSTRALDRAAPQKQDPHDPPAAPRKPRVDPAPEADPQVLKAPFAPAGMTRDYFITEDDGGRRFWLFRQGLYGGEAFPGWFLHGFFA